MAPMWSRIGYGGMSGPLSPPRPLRRLPNQVKTGPTRMRVLSAGYRKPQLSSAPKARPPLAQPT